MIAFLLDSSTGMLLKYLQLNVKYKDNALLRLQPLPLTLSQWWHHQMPKSHSEKPFHPPLPGPEKYMSSKASNTSPPVPALSHPSPSHNHLMLQCCSRVGISLFFCFFQSVCHRKTQLSNVWFLNSVSSSSASYFISVCFLPEWTKHR